MTPDFATNSWMGTFLRSLCRIFGFKPDRKDHAEPPKIRHNRAGYRPAAKREPEITPSLPVECQICFSSIEPGNVTSVSPHCDHKEVACATCVDQHIATQIESQVDLNIQCPFDTNHISFADIQKHASPSTFNRYETLLLRRTLSALEGSLQKSS